MNTERNSLSLTVILVKDDIEGFTSYFAEFPNIIAEGDTEEEATKNLFRLTTTVFNYQKKEEENKVKSYGTSVQTRSYHLAEV